MSIPYSYWEVASVQLALDLNTSPEAFSSGQVVVTENIHRPGRRVYGGTLENPSPMPFFQCMVFATSAVFCVDSSLTDWCEQTFGDATIPLLFQMDTFQTIDAKLLEYDHYLYDLHHAYLPENDNALPTCQELRWYDTPEELEPFRGDTRFSNALSFQPTAPDRVAVTAMDGQQVMGMAGVSADGKDLWQIGVDVLPAYRGKGLAGQLVSQLKRNVLQKGKVPFYGMATSNVASRTVAQKTGFSPAWVSLASRPLSQKD